MKYVYEHCSNCGKRNLLDHWSTISDGEEFVEMWKTNCVLCGFPVWKAKVVGRSEYEQ